MPGSVKARLAGMMFLQYAIWGSWYVTLNTYLTETLKFSGAEAGAVFGTVSIACLVSPFFVGLVADRFIATEYVMAALYAAGAIVMVALITVTSFAGVYALLLIFCLLYFPTIALSNSIAMQQVADPGRDFPPIRVAGTLGWIAVNVLVGALAVEAGTTPFLIGAAACGVMCLYSLIALPHTPPTARREAVTWRRMIGLDALVMLRDRSYLIFVLASILACIPLTFYYSFTNAYLNEIGVSNAAGKMALGQGSEVVMLLAMPLAFRVLNLRWVLLIGLFAWAVRYGLLAFGNAGAGMWMLYAAILLHGVCYDFFFVAGQLYTDQTAPPHLRSTAQGFITLVTYGLGMLIGSFLSGFVLDHFTRVSDGRVVRDWPSFWLSSALMSAVIAAVVFVFFRSRTRVRAQAT